MEGTTIWRKMITEMRGADLMVCRINEICKEYNLMRFYFFELKKCEGEKFLVGFFRNYRCRFCFGGRGDGLKWCPHKVISAQSFTQCLVATRDVSSFHHSNMCASFCPNAWVCAPRATNRDLESVFARRKVNAWICACQATDRDLETKG